MSQSNANFYVAPSTIHGKGLFARVYIAEGEYIGTYHGFRSERDGKYVMWMEEEGGPLYGRRGYTQLRYLNHDDDPNGVMEGYDLYAGTDIHAGEEITIDYSGGED